MQRVLSRHLIFALVMLAETGRAQTPPPGGSLAITGYSGQVPIVEIDGKSYVEIGSLARLTSGSLSFQAASTILTLGPQTDQPAKMGFSTDFMKAGIEAMTAIREWRIAVIHAIQNSYPLTESWVGRYRRTAETKLALASAGVSTEADRSGFPLLGNEFANMKTLSDTYVALREKSTGITQDDLDKNQLDQQILNCARGLATLAASGQFEDVPSCH
jgi:hypothetical protein